MGAATNGSESRFPDVGDVGSHLGPDWNLRNLSHPARDFFSQIRMLAHFGSHFPLGHPVGTRKVKLETIDSSVLNQSRQFLPARLIILLHNRSDQNVVRIVLLDLTKLIEPDIDRTVRDEFYVFKTDHFTRHSRAQLAVARNNIDYFRRFE